QQTFNLPRLARRRPKHTLEGFPESACGFESVFDLGRYDRRAATNFTKRESHAPGPVISVKCHAVVPLELAPGRGWIDVHILQVLIGQLLGRRSLYQVEQPARQLWRSMLIVHWLASLAGSIAMNKRFLRSGEILNVLGPRLSRGACGPAEYSGCSYG